MKQKELKNIAKKIAEQEKIIQQSSDDKAIARAENEIVRLCSGIKKIEDMVMIDELVLEILDKT